MDDAALCIESADYPIEIACVLMLVSSPNRPCKEVGQLNET